MKPTYRTTAGERKASAGSIDTSDILRHYRNRMRGRGQWEGLPEGCPPGYIEDTALWFSPGAGIKEIRGMGPGLLPVNASTRDIYGRPVTWLPSVIQGVTAYTAQDDLYTESDMPVLWIGTCYEDQIKPYAQLMGQALKTLGQNLNALSQPVMINGRPTGIGGDNIGGVMLASDFAEGRLFVPSISGEGAPLEVLDLHAQDHTQNLISVIQACDARILEILDLSNGIEKSSGISDMETATGALGLDAGQGGFKELADEWCERVNDAMGLSLRYNPRTVKVAEAQPEENQEDENDDDREA